MTPRALLKAFDVLAESPGGTQRLRALVLELAVRGKLVPQNPRDEPASKLLARIAAEKARLVKAGKIRAPKPLPPVREDEVPFEVPNGWAWVRFGTVTESRLGKMLDKSKNRGSYRPYLRNANVQWFCIGIDDVLQLRLEEDEIEEYSLRVGDLLICEGGEPGRAAICDNSVEGMAFQKALHRARPYAGVHVHYLAYLLRNDTWSGSLEKYFTGATIKHFTGKALDAYVIPLPPSAEQQRIVARVDELMAFLDRLEAARGARDATREALRDAALAALRDAPDAAAVEVAWARVAQRMDELFTAPADVAPLRQTILQLAVRGKLVPQNPRDEPAPALLARIATEKARLIKQGKLRASNPLPPVNIDEAPFGLPKDWLWIRIGDCFAVAGGIQKTSKRRPVHNAYPYMRVANVQRGKLDLAEIAQFELFEDELDQWRLEPGDVLIVEGNGSESEVGRGARWGGEIKDCVHQNHLIRCRPLIASLEYFVLRYLNSPAGIATMKALAVTTSGLYNLSVGKIRNIAVPLPSLAEQRRIVAKVDALMALCDQLQARLGAMHEAQATFAAAAVHHLDT